MKRERDDAVVTTTINDLPDDVLRLCLLVAPQALWQCVSRRWYTLLSQAQLPWWEMLPLVALYGDGWRRVVEARTGLLCDQVPARFYSELEAVRDRLYDIAAEDIFFRHLLHYVWDLKPLAIVNFHPRDMAATFEERGHVYTLRVEEDLKRVQRAQIRDGPFRERLTSGLGASTLTFYTDKTGERRATYTGYFLRTNVVGSEGAYTSGTALVAPLFEQFDALGMSQRCAGKGKYVGLSAEQVRAQWEANGQARSGRGTHAHARIEDDLNGWPCSLHGVGDDAPFAIYREFVADHITSQGLRPFRSEWTVHWQALRLVGQIDAVYEYVDPEKRRPDAQGMIHLALMADWKCAEEVKHEGYVSDFDRKRGKRGKCGIAPCTAKLQDCNAVQWQLQLLIYARILREYGYVVDAMCDVVVHPTPKPPRPAGATRYQRLDVAWDEALVEALVQNRRDVLAAEAPHVVVQ